MGEILRALAKAGSGSALSLVLGAAMMKVLAVLLGPGGVGLFSLLRQTHLMALTIAILNGQTALVQGIASREGNRRARYAITVGLVMVCAAALVGGGMVILAPLIAELVLGSRDPARVTLIRWLALPVVMSVGYTYLTSLLNGHRAIGRLALVQASGVGAMAALAYPVARAVSRGSEVPLTWLLTVSSIAGCAVALAFLHRGGMLPDVRSRIRRLVDPRAAASFFGMVRTLLVTGIVMSGAHLAVRAMVARGFGLEGAGLFDVAWTFSMMYVLLLLTSFQTYYLPTLSRTTDAGERNALIARVLRVALVAFVPMVAGILMLKPVVLTVLYSPEFLPAVGTMQWMLIGDYFKITAWVFAVPMLAYADMKMFFRTEALWAAILLTGAALAVTVFRSLPAVGLAYLVTNAVYAVVLVLYTIRRYSLKLGSALLARWMVGLTLVVAVAAFNWGATRVNWWGALAGSLALILYLAFSLGRAERRFLIERLGGRFGSAHG